MSADRVTKPKPSPGPRPSLPMSEGEARKRQKAYAAHRRDWAEAVGRPYGKTDADPRPPPGELDAGPDE